MEFLIANFAKQKLGERHQNIYVQSISMGRLGSKSHRNLSFHGHSQVDILRIFECQTNYY